MPRIQQCQAARPLTCPHHGAALALGLLQKGATARVQGLEPARLTQFSQASEADRAQLTEDEYWSLRYYTGIGSSSVNAYLRGGEAAMIEEELRNDHLADTPANRTLAADDVRDMLPRVHKEIATLDAAFRKLQPTDTPRVLYRAHRVLSPTGDSTSAAEKKAHVVANYQLGQIVQNKAYTSTSLDSDYILYNSRRRPSQVVVHEIVSDRGLNLYAPDDGNIRHAEREVLLPRDSVLEVVGITHATFEQSPHAKQGADLWGLTAPTRKRYPVIQFRDITEV